MFRAAFVSRSCTAPHAQQVHSLIPRPALPFGLLAGMTPQHEHVWGDVLDDTEYLTAIPVADPTELWQLDSALHRIDYELLWVWVPEAIALTFLLKTREIGTFLEEILVGTLQVLEHLLERMGRSV